MKKLLSLLLCAALVIALGIVCAGAETAAVKVTTTDKLMTIELPNNTWYQLITPEHNEMFSDGDCTIVVDFYKDGDKLPAIETATKEHAFVYTAACATQEYIMLVTGYAHEKSDFSGMVRSINTIVVNTEELAKVNVNHTVNTSEFSIRDTWYSAWVNAERLNVRAGSGTDNAIITSINRNTRVTVTGTVLHNGYDYGWSRVTLENGTQGYVATQYLTTNEPRPATVGPNGQTMTLYTSDGTPVALYQYTDGSWKTASGVKYWRTTSGNYTNDYGDLLFEKNPTAGAYRTGYSLTLYRANGSVTIVYEYSNGLYMDDSGMTYSRYNNGQWQAGTGELFDLEPPAAQAATATGETTEVYDSYGNLYYLYKYTDGTWRLDGVVYDHTVELAWYGSNGNVLYTYNPVQEAAPSAYTESSPDGRSVLVYDQYGNQFYIDHYSDGSWRLNGEEFDNVTEYEWIGTWGSVLYTYNPAAGAAPSAYDEATPDGRTLQVYDQYGNPFTLTHYSDGTWRLNGEEFDNVTEFVWEGTWGSVLYTYNPAAEPAPSAY